MDGESVPVEVTAGGVLVGGKRVEARLVEVDGTPLCSIVIGGVTHRLAVLPGKGRGRYALWTDDYRFEVEALDERTRAIRALSARTGVRAGPATLVAPMPGLIVRIAVSAGDKVEAGQGLVVMEAMKMENELRATAAGTVVRVLVSGGEAVEKGAILVELS